MLYLHLFHGRKDPDETLDDWGSDGPYLGPFDYLHTTYASEVKVANSTAGLESCLYVIGDLLYYDDCYYGDWSAVDKLPDGQISTAFDVANTQSSGKRKYSEQHVTGFSWHSSSSSANTVPQHLLYTRLWSPSLNSAASDDGWNLFDAAGSKHGRWQIQRLDCPESDDGPMSEPKFRSDDEAAAYVIEKSLAGSPLHRMAIITLVALGSKDVDRFGMTAAFEQITLEATKETTNGKETKEGVPPTS